MICPHQPQSQRTCQSVLSLRIPVGVVSKKTTCQSVLTLKIQMMSKLLQTHSICRNRVSTCQQLLMRAARMCLVCKVRHCISTVIQGRVTVESVQQSPTGGPCGCERKPQRTLQVRSWEAAAAVFRRIVVQQFRQIYAQELGTDDASGGLRELNGLAAELSQFCEPC